MTRFSAWNRNAPTAERSARKHLSTLSRERADFAVVAPGLATTKPEALRLASWQLAQPLDFNFPLKRLFDVIVGTIALVGSLPLLAIASLLILLEDGAPVIFMQNRVGQSGRVFRMLKLRTMIHGAEALRLKPPTGDEASVSSLKGKLDPRVTRVGRILRRLSIDELPQLVNVLLGDMSLVGPRPELPEIVGTYEPWQLQRLMVPQGMTGWWQVSGRSEHPMRLHTEDDLYYVRNLSFRLDLEILVRTVWVVLEGRGAY